MQIPTKPFDQLSPDQRAWMVAMSDAWIGVGEDGKNKIFFTCTNCGSQVYVIMFNVHAIKAYCPECGWTHKTY